MNAARGKSKNRTFANSSGPQAGSFSYEDLFNQEKPFALHRRFDCPDQLLVSIRLPHVTIRSSLPRFLNELLVLVGRENDDGGIWNMNADAPGSLEAGHLGHRNVDDDHIRLQRFSQTYSMLTVSGFANDFKAMMGFQNSLNHVQYRWVVVRDENTNSWSREIL